MLRYRLQVPWGRWCSSLASLPISSFLVPSLPVHPSPSVLCSSCSLCFRFCRLPTLPVAPLSPSLPCSFHSRWVSSRCPCSSPQGTRGCGSGAGLRSRCGLLLTPAVTALLVARPAGDTEGLLPVWFTGLSRKQHTQTALPAHCTHSPASEIGFASLPLCAAREAWRTQTHTDAHRHTQTRSDPAALSSCPTGTDAQQRHVWRRLCSSLLQGAGTQGVPGAVPAHPSADTQVLAKGICWSDNPTKFQGPAPKCCVSTS